MWLHACLRRMSRGVLGWYVHHTCDQLCILPPVPCKPSAYEEQFATHKVCTLALSMMSLCGTASQHVAAVHTFKEDAFRTTQLPGR